VDHRRGLVRDRSDRSGGRLPAASFATRAVAALGRAPVAAPALRPPRETVEQMIAEHEATLRAAERGYGRQIRAGAEELVRTGATVVRVSNVQLQGRIVGFWRGDSVLQLEKNTAYFKPLQRREDRVARADTRQAHHRPQRRAAR